MQLIGMFDSPFVRRVAISLTLLELPFEHCNWSVGKDFDALRERNPLGRVPALVLDDGEVLVESSAILDYLDEQAGPARALLPRTGAARRKGLQIMSLATGAAEKGVSVIYESAFRPPEHRHAPWVERCRTQVHGALRALDALCADTDSAQSVLGGERLLQPDITLTCAYVFLREAVGVDDLQYVALSTRALRNNERPEFRATYLKLDPPKG